MIFNTGWFLIFFVAAYGILNLLPGRQLRFYALLVLSAVFHWHFAGPAGVAPIVAMAVAVYVIALRLSAAEGAARQRWLALGLAVPVAGLVFYKYRVFVIENLALAWPSLPQRLGPWSHAPFLPLAISFFTFEFVHYLVDVYHGGQPLRRPAVFALFCIYFPSIASGPIKRYQDFNAQVDGGLERPWKSNLKWEGLAQVITGYFKKIVVADNATVLVGLLEAKADLGRGPVLLLMLLLSIRILFDFSGYSDMAIGFSKLLGLRLPANFNFPYWATNPSDFWRRWHMSLSSWIRDYIYIPLGGSRKGPARRVANGVAAMVICGLWHGPAWHFALWGLFHGAGLALHGAYRKWRPAQEAPPLWKTGLARLALFSFVSYGWLLFFYPLPRVFRMTATLLGL